MSRISSGPTIKYVHTNKHGVNKTRFSQNAKAHKPYKQKDRRRKKMATKNRNG